MEIKRTPPGTALPLEEDELEAFLVGTQLIAAAGLLKRKIPDMVRAINEREAIPSEGINVNAILHGGELSTTIVLRVVAAAQAAHDEVTLANAGDTVN